MIIPTLGLRAREKLLWRAIESVVSQEGVQAIPLVVLNGQEADPDLEARLRADQRLRLIRLQEPSLPLSLREGRANVDTPWFAELDDDDYLLPNALALRVGALARDPEFNVVVTNGFRGQESGNTLHIHDISAVEKDPLGTLTRRNWLLPGAWLCRTEEVGEWVFDGMPPFRECTFLAIQFATRCKVRYLQEPTVVYDMRTEASASSSGAYILSGAPSQLALMKMDIPPEIRESFRRRISGEHHNAADWHLSQGNRLDAWKSHLASLRWPGGWRYLPYTARVLLHSFRP